MSFRERIDSARPLVLDGGMGSALIARGLVQGAPPEIWNIDRPADVRDVHRAFVTAGTEAIQTNTFGGNPIRLAAHGLEQRCEELNQAAVSLARDAGPAFVVGDIGPTGEYLAPVGNGDPNRWRECFVRQSRSLAEAGVDAFHIETMSDLREARIALDAVRSVAPDAPVMVSLTFDRKKRGFFTVMGDPLVASLRSLIDSGADVSGANCTLSSADMVALVEELKESGLRRLVVQPNAGQPMREEDGSVRYAQLPDEFADDMAVIAERGASVLGGCCGTDERFIAALRARLEAGA